MNKLKQFYFSIILVVVTLSGFYISDDVRAVFSLIRYFLAGLLSIITLFFIISFFYKNTKLSVNNFYIFLYLLLLTYGLLLATINGGIWMVLEIKNLILLIISIFFSLSLMQQIEIIYTKSSEIKERYIFSFIFSIYIITSLIFIIYMEALSFGPLPTFYYFLNGERYWYSQATTLMFGLSGIVFMYSSMHHNGVQSIIYIFLGLGMMILSLFSGARGEFIISFLVMLMLMFRIISMKNLLYFFLISAILIYIFLSNFSLNDIYFLERMSSVIAGADLGGRDYFLYLSLNLLTEKPICLISGCGFNFFQVFYDFPYGKYPHNIIAELLITYGMFISFPVLILAIFGVISGYFSQIGNNLHYYIMLVIFGITFKSGSLLSVMHMPAVLFFVVVGIKNLSKFKDIKNKFSPLKAR